MSKLNRSVRYLVLNATNQAVKPKDEMLAGFDPAVLARDGEIRKKHSPSFKNRAKAEAFGAALAGKYAGQRFYLAQIVSGCVVEPATGPWVATGAAVRDDLTAEDIEGLDGDGEDNE